MKNIIILGCLMLLLSCASSYQLSPAVKKINESLNTESAIAILSRCMNSATTNWRLTDGASKFGEKNAFGLNLEDKPIISVTSEGYFFKAYSAGEFIKKEKIDLNKSREYYKPEFNYYERKFKNIIKIRITPLNKKPFIVSSFNLPSANGYEVLIYSCATCWERVVVQQKDIDEFIAAINKLIPNARLISDIGL